LKKKVEYDNNSSLEFFDNKDLYRDKNHEKSFVNNIFILSIFSSNLHIDSLSSLIIFEIQLFYKSLKMGSGVMFFVDPLIYTLILI